MEFNATIYVTIISFILFAWIMNKIFYEPLTKIMVKRDNLVNENYAEAEQMSEKTEAIISDKEKRLTDTAKQARQILIDKTAQANFDYKHNVSEARDRSMRKILELKNELMQSKEQALPVLEQKVDELAVEIADKVLKGGQSA